ncbi:Hypothetical predicted protein [Cloeon dipterum]|uniref:dual-specificity kinase n=2 Tax=Cloeon dipterum TaxID=197152 RepID=A0A8S1DUM8_9INSE|nr:Hypothetical predicted protein [Cloeon dipterum]
MPSSAFIYPAPVGGSSSSSSLSSLSCSSAPRGGSNESTDYGFVSVHHHHHHHHHQQKAATMEYRRPQQPAATSPIRNALRKSASLLSANWWASRLLSRPDKPEVVPPPPPPTMTRRWRSVGTLLKQQQQQQQQRRPRANTLLTSQHRPPPKEFYLLDDFLAPPTSSCFQPPPSDYAKQRRRGARNPPPPPPPVESPEPPPVPPPPPSDLFSDSYRRSIGDRSCHCRSCDVRLIHESYASLLQQHHRLNANSGQQQKQQHKEIIEYATIGRSQGPKVHHSSTASRLSHISSKSVGTNSLCVGTDQKTHELSGAPASVTLKQAGCKMGGNNNNQKLDNHQQLSPNNNSTHCSNKSTSTSPSLESSPRKSSDSGRSSSAGSKDGTVYPISSTEALKLYGSRLTQHERNEINEYPQVWYLGLDACKVHPEENGAQNGGYDDENGSYHKVLHDQIAFRYEILEVIGRGSFGQVIKALDHKTNTYVAIKIIRNKKRFHHQALVEVKILDHLRKKDREGTNNIIHMLEYFYFRNHLCITFELMSLNLYELIKKNNYQGFSLNLIQRFTKSLVHCLRLLFRENIIHCDLKPENVLLKQRGSTGIKVIDFGSSCYTHHRVFTYIQSRFYRSPEVILGLPYGTPIDMWSLGCILAELYTGYPLFPGENEMEQLACVMEILGLPPKSVLAAATRRRLFFDSKGQPRCITNSKGRKRKPSSKDLSSAIRCSDRLFVDFISQCLEWDASKRMTPDEASKHPWLNQSGSAPFEFQRCQSQEAPTPSHKASGSAAASAANNLSSTRSESDLPGSVLPPAPPPVGEAYSLYRVYRGTRKAPVSSKERLSSADAATERRRGAARVGSGMQRESSLPEKSSLTDSGTFLPPIL